MAHRDEKIRSPFLLSAKETDGTESIIIASAATNISLVFIAFCVPYELLRRRWHGDAATLILLGLFRRLQARRNLSRAGIVEPATAVGYAILPKITEEITAALIQQSKFTTAQRRDN